MAWALIWVAGAHSQLGQYAQALEYDKRALELRQALFPGNENHETVAESLASVGDAYWRLGRPGESLEYGLRGLRMREAVHHGMDHADVA